MTRKPSTADAVRASVIRRPTGAAATARAASTFQASDETRTSTVHAPIRTTLHLTPSLWTGLKRPRWTRHHHDRTNSGSHQRGTTGHGWASSGLNATSASRWQGAHNATDLPRDMHRTLKRLAAEEDTSVQALVSTAIQQAHPDLA